MTIDFSGVNKFDLKIKDLREHKKDNLKTEDSLNRLGNKDEDIFLCQHKEEKKPEEKKLDLEKIKTLFKDLDDDDYQIREKAERDLKTMRNSLRSDELNTFCDTLIKLYQKGSLDQRNSIDRILSLTFEQKFELAFLKDISPSVYGMLKSKYNPIIKLAILENRDLPKDELEEKFDSLPDFYKRKLIADTKSELLKEIALDTKDRELLMSLASNKDINEELINKLLKFQDPLILLVLIKSRKVGPEKLNELAKKFYFLRPTVANSLDTPKEVLEKLSEDEEGAVRMRVAGNENTPVKVLEKMFLDKDPVVQDRLACNKSTPIHILEKFLVDKDAYIRGAVAHNPNVKKEWLEILSNDPEPACRARVAFKTKDTKLMEKFLNDESSFVQFLLAKNENLPQDMLFILANDKDERARRGVANNDKAPKEILAMLSLDKEQSVRGGVASNSNTHPDVLKNLVKDQSPDVRAAILENKEINIEILKTLQYDSDPDIADKAKYLLYRKLMESRIKKA